MATASLKVPPGVPRSCMVPDSQRKAWVSPAAVRLLPTIWPASLIARRMGTAPLVQDIVKAWLVGPTTLWAPPSVPRSRIVPDSQMNACIAPLAVVLEPAIWPDELMATAMAVGPPNVPRSRIAPDSQMNGCVAPAAVRLTPTIWPAVFTAVAVLDEPPSVPRSVVTPATHENAWTALPVLMAPTTWPEALIAFGKLLAPVRSIVELPDAHRTAWVSAPNAGAIGRGKDSTPTT